MVCCDVVHGRVGGVAVLFEQVDVEASLVLRRPAHCTSCGQQRTLWVEKPAERLLTTWSSGSRERWVQCMSEIVQPARGRVDSARIVDEGKQHLVVAGSGTSLPNALNLSARAPDYWEPSAVSSPH